MSARPAVDEAASGAPSQPSPATSAHEKHAVFSGNEEEHDGPGVHDDSSSAHSSVQAGVKQIEAISQVWTFKSLFIAYVGVFLMAYVTSLESQVTSPATPFITSSFQRHSLIPTIAIVNSVVSAVGKPPMAKIADVFGRIEAFCVSIGLYVIGYIIMATSHNVQTYAAAQIFTAFGNTGLLVLQQIFIADTTDLSWRAMMSTLPDIPYLINIWIGVDIYTDINRQTGSWRWAVAMWTIILPAAFAPLLASLIYNNRRARKLGLVKPKQYISRKGSVSGVSRPVAFKTFMTRTGHTAWGLWKELDLGGLLLLAAGLGLILITCTIANQASNQWENPSMIAMLVIGSICLVAYPFWETSTYVARKYRIKGTLGKVLREISPYPFTPLYLLKSRTVIAGCLIVFFDFMAFNLSVFPYFNSYLLVVRNLPIRSAYYITSIFTFSSTCSSLLASLCIKVTQRYKWFIVFGACFYTLGLGLMILYRQPDSSMSAIIGSQICIGFGSGFFVVPAQLGVQASAGHQNQGAATAVFLTILSIGSAVGQAISGNIWTKQIPIKLVQYLPESAQANATAIFGDIDVARAYAVGTPERDAIVRSYNETMRILVTIAACTSAPIILCAFLMRDYHLDEMQQGVKGRVIGGQVADDGTRQDVIKGNPYNPSTWVNNAQDWWQNRRRARAEGARAEAVVN